MKSLIEAEIGAVSQQMQQLAAESSETIAAIAQLCLSSMRKGGKVLFCGNGGSAADAQHLAAELVGRYKLNRPAYAAIALTTDSSVLTAVGNDFGYDTVFERQVEGVGKPGDVLIGISTSGNSKNVLLAIRKAKSMGIATVAFTGSAGGQMAGEADIALRVPSDMTNHIQEMHITCGHLICGLVEQGLAQG